MSGATGRAAPSGAGAFDPAIPPARGRGMPRPIPREAPRAVRPRSAHRWMPPR